jgi:hypothetical protein
MPKYFCSEFNDVATTDKFIVIVDIMKYEMGLACSTHGREEISAVLTG